MYTLCLTNIPFIIYKRVQIYYQVDLELKDLYIVLGFSNIYYSYIKISMLYNKIYVVILYIYVHCTVMIIVFTVVNICVCIYLRD